MLLTLYTHKTMEECLDLVRRETPIQQWNSIPAKILCGCCPAEIIVVVHLHSFPKVQSMQRQSV
jgi:hypothetical protein